MVFAPQVGSPVLAPRMASSRIRFRSSLGQNGPGEGSLPVGGAFRFRLAPGLGTVTSTAPLSGTLYFVGTLAMGPCGIAPGRGKSVYDFPAEAVTVIGVWRV